MKNSVMHKFTSKCVDFLRKPVKSSLKTKIINGSNTYYLMRKRCNNRYFYYYSLLYCSPLRVKCVGNTVGYTSKLETCYITHMTNPPTITNYVWRIQNGYYYNDSVGYMHRYVMGPSGYQKIKFKDGNKLNLLFSNMELIDDAIKLKKRRPELIIKANY